MNRDLLRRAAEELGIGAESDEGSEAGAAEARRAADEGFGSPEALITHAVDVRPVLDRKRAAMQAHASQISPDSFFMKMPAEIFAMAFGTEWYIDLANPRPEGEPFATDLFAEPA